MVDDTAVTPTYVTGFSPERELPMIGRIALGSLRNKLLILLPAALLLSAFLPVAITPILMIGGAFLCFEGAEKILETIVRGRPWPSRGRSGRTGDPAHLEAGQGQGRDPHRPHPLGRDHGHRARRLSDRPLADAGSGAGCREPHGDRRASMAPSHSS